MSRRTALLITALVALGCAPPRAKNENLAILLAAPATRSEREAVRVQFADWLSHSVRTPGATFEVLEAGCERGQTSLLFAAVIPASWGAPNAVANRQRFVATMQRDVVVAMQGGRPRHYDVASPSPRLVTLPTLDSRGARWQWIQPSGRVHHAILCDVSPSATGVSCTPASLLHAVDAWVVHGLAPRSTLRVWIVGTSVSTVRPVFVVDTPELPIAERAAYLLGARRELARVLEHASPYAGSAIAEALAVAATDLASRDGAKVLRILSDLRQSSGPWTFDRAVPPPHEFVRWLAAERLLSNCDGIVVSLCGIHFGATPKYPPFTARQGALVRDVWTHALTAMHARVLGMCSECDAEAFQTGGTDMGSRPQKQNRKQAAQIGTNRGGRAFVDAVPPDTPDMIREWMLIDPKAGRPAALAAKVQERFPTIRTVPREVDGRHALAFLDADAVIVGTVDTVEATRALVSTRRPQQTLCLQLVGRGPGPPASATRLGISAIVRDESVSQEAALLLDGFATISEAASSRALTAAGDPMSAALLHPMRLAATRLTVRYFREALDEVPLLKPPLTFLTASDAYPLIVRPTPDRTYNVQRAAALEAVEHLQTHRTGIIAAVALVDLEEHVIDMFFIDQSRGDRRRVDGIAEFRASTQRFAARAIFTD